MTKFSRILMCALLCAVVLCMGAFAAETVNPDENGAYTVEYTNTAGEYYAILVVEGTYEAGETPTITEDSIIYISQETADAQGVATFADFKLKSNVAGTIYIGGSNMDAAVLYGYTTPVNEGYDVTGTVTVDSGSAVEANVTLTSTTDAGKVYTATTVSGVYTITVPADTYKFVVTKKAHLSYTDNEYAVTAAATKDVALKGGDINANGEIDHVDLNALVADYYAASDLTDVNADGVVNHVDLNILIANYYATSVVE